MARLSLAQAAAVGGLSLAVGLPVGSPAQTDAPAGKRAVATRVSIAITLDGRLDEAAWSAAAVLRDFSQKEPVQFADPTERTEVAFLYDDHALYIGARLFSTDPATVPRDVTRRDQYGNSEHIVVSLDPYLDRRTAYSFSVTSGGVRRDYFHSSDSDEFFARDFTYDPVWEAKAVFDSAGWTAEMRIPFSQLRFNDREVQTWGLNVRRWIPQKNEDDQWVVVPRDETGFVSRFGILTGIRAIPGSRRIELLPYAAATGELSSTTAPGDPFNDGSRGNGRVGADLKMGLGPNLTLNATINPDFGQVEADPAELNLTAFETFFSERRPFFTESREILEGPVINYFYSRRIGGPPRGDASGDYVDFPRYTTILGAAKLTGRLPSGLSVGMLTAVTQREFARTFSTGTGRFDRIEVEPTATFGVLRAQQQFGPSASTVGFSLSGMRRYFGGSSTLPTLLTRQALAGGGDWRLRFQGGAYQVSGHVGFGWVEGSSDAILLIQQASARYFQRPDAGHVRLDPTRTSLLGLTASLGAEKEAGDWLWRVEGRTESPGFEANDMGRLSSADDLDLSWGVSYRETDPGRRARRWSVGAFGNAQWNYGGDRGETRVGLRGHVQWANYVETRLEVYHNPRGVSDNLTRGGPLMGTGRFSGIGLEANSNMTRPSGWRLNGEYGSAETGTRYRQLGGSLFFRPSAKWGFSVDPGWLHFTDTRQYIQEVPGGPPATFGTRYVFAAVDQSVLSATLRVNYTFTPDFTLELYAEPFAASGRYSQHGELPAPRRIDLRLYGTDGTSIVRQADEYMVTDARDGATFSIPVADFNNFSFRTNLVLRWEWRRGSTLYLVWQQNRFGQCSAFSELDDCPTGAAPGTLVRPGFLTDALRVPGNHYLAVKVSYWVPIN